MSRITIEAVTDVIGEFVDLSGVSPTERSVLGEDIPLDSREMLRVISRLEALYGGAFSPRDLLSVRTLGDLVDATRRCSGVA